LAARQQQMARHYFPRVLLALAAMQMEMRAEGHGEMKRVLVGQQAAGVHQQPSWSAVDALTPRGDAQLAAAA
jgi:hypothetical protein